MKTQKLLKTTSCILAIVFTLTACNKSNSDDKTNHISKYADNILKQEIIENQEIDTKLFTKKIFSSLDINEDDYKKAYVLDDMIGGESTDKISNTTSQAYAQPMNTLNEKDMQMHLSGDANFETSFIGSKTSSDYLAVLGPVHNNTNCDKCHLSDGRASLPYVKYLNFNDTMFKDLNGYYKLRNAGVFLRISIENEKINKAKKDKTNNWGSPIAVPNFSDQLHHRGNIGLRDDKQSYATGLADVWMKYKRKLITYPDGSTVELSKPLFFVDNPYDAPDNPKVYDSIDFSKDSKSRLFKDDVKMGPRIGMPMFGLGLLDAINEKDILALADPDDNNEDGISGKVNIVFDKEKFDYCSNIKNNLPCDKNPPLSLGRYGWKANTPTVAHQGLGALRGDMGVTNPLFKNESIASTDLMKNYKKKVGSSFITYDDTKSDADLDADLRFSQDIVFYTETLSVPARRDPSNDEVKKGAVIFEKISCAKCHNPSFTTGNKSASYSKKHNRNPYLKKDNIASKIKELENQVIYPYTDMLLHDMGEALADGRKDGDANGNEWKTRPLWGIGLTKLVNPAAGFLHDGRARTLEEAIIWHGGEALTSKLHFMKLSKSDREALIKFLEDL